MNITGSPLLISLCAIVIACCAWIAQWSLWRWSHSIESFALRLASRTGQNHLWISNRTAELDRDISRMRDWLDDHEEQLASLTGRVNHLQKTAHAGHQPGDVHPFTADAYVTVTSEP